MASVNPSLDNTLDDPSQRSPLVLGDLDYGGVTDTVCKIWEAEKQPKIWYIVLGLALSLLLVLGGCLNHLIMKGTGVWGNNNPAYWGWPIVNFVFWVGIGHAGTLISAILFLFRQNWRTSINRAAEAMTIFAVVCAGLFPGVHIGRVWSFYWLFPIPTEHLAMWYMGMVPDIATFRDRCKSKIGKVIYGLLSLGWTGSARAWHRYEIAYTILAALATPLVLSVHTIVSFDFAVSQVPGWHTTIFPPYFVAGAIFSGFAMVVTLAFLNRAFGNYWWAYWIMVSCNVLIPQLFWFKWCRTTPWFMVIVCIFVNIGMWFERFVITITSLCRDFLPSSWAYFHPTIIDIMMLIGSFGLFFTLFTLFCRFLPVIAMAEVKRLAMKIREAFLHTNKTDWFPLTFPSDKNHG